MKQNLHLMATLWPLLRLRAFFNRCLNPTKMQSLSGTGMPEAEAYLEVLRHTKVSREYSRLASCPSPPSLTLPSGPIPMCPAYTSVKNPKSGTLANSKRLHSGRKAYMEGHGVGWNTCSSTTRGWFKYAGAIVLPLLGCASAFSRSVVEGFSKPTRIIVEALSKDCRTSLEQQSNTCRRNFEESCVWTHAMAPARNGLGLALGLMVTLFLTIMCLEARAQSEGTDVPKNFGTPDQPSTAPPGNKSFTEIITVNAKSRYGMLGAHEVGGKIYLEIPDSLLGRDILTINRLAKGWAGDKPFDPFLNFIGFSGDLANESLFRFDRESDYAIAIYPLDYSTRIQAEDGMLALPTNADMQPILHSFPIVCRNRADDGSLVDATDFLSGDNIIMTFSNSLRRKFNVGTMQPQHSAISGVEVTDSHLVTTSVKTYSYNSETVRLGICAVWFLLPVIPYEIRQPDDRVGYYTQSATDYSNAYAPQQSLRMVKRWRMEPRPEDREAYFRGELVEPAKPLVIYIDPAMPEAWVPYMIQGINDWQPALEQAGFKNAIRGERVPSGMESRMVGDARYPMVCYKPSPIANATAELVTDPRSGEIINAQIALHHGMLGKINQWGVAMAAVHRPRLRGNQTDTAFIGAMIRKIIAHEVGHVLGLLHNFGASSTVAVENLRKPDWLAAHAISPSIMDYVRINYVAQPEDNVPLSGLLPRVGPYDRWAIEWAYRLHPPTGDKQEDRESLNNWVAETGSDRELWYGAEERQSTDPRCQAEDLGDDPVLAAGYGIKNLQRVVDSLNVWYPDPGRANEVCRELIGQYQNYLNHVTVLLNEDAKQRALGFAMDSFVDEPHWLTQRLPEGSGGGSPAAHLARCQQQTLAKLLAILVANGAHAELALLQNRIFDGPDSQTDYGQRMQWLYVTEVAKLTDYHAGLHKRYLSARIAERIQHATSESERFRLESLLSILSANPTN